MIREKDISQQEIDKTIAEAKAIWGIEDMSLSVDEENIAREYLEGKISTDEYRRRFLSAK